jgi:hypothetical protein
MESLFRPGRHHHFVMSLEIPPSRGLVSWSETLRNICQNIFIHTKFPVTRWFQPSLDGQLLGDVHFETSLTSLETE